MKIDECYTIRKGEIIDHSFFTSIIESNTYETVVHGEGVQ